MPVTRRTRNLSQNCTADAGSAKSALSGRQESQNIQPDRRAAAKCLRSGVLGLPAEQFSKLGGAFVSLSRIVTDHSSSNESNDGDSDNTPNLQGGKIHRKEQIIDNVQGCPRYIPNRNATASSADNVILYKISTRTGQNNRKLSSQSQQMDPIIEISNKTMLCRSDEKEMSESERPCDISVHNASMRTMRCLRPRINSTAASHSSESNHSVLNEVANKKASAHSSKTNRPLPKTQRKHVAHIDSITNSLSSDKSTKYSSSSSETDDASLSSGEFENSTSSIIFQRVSVPSGSFYSKKSSKTPRLISWLQSANPGKKSTPTEHANNRASRSTRTNSLRQKGAASDISYSSSTSGKHSSDGRLVISQKTIGDRKASDAALDQSLNSEKSNDQGSEISQNTASRGSAINSKMPIPQSSTDPNGSGRSDVISRLRTAKNDRISSSSISPGFRSEKSKLDMKAVNSETPASRITRSALKHGNSSTPHPIQQESEVEYMFGFENLLEPAVTLLQDVSPIPQPLLPEASRKRKVQRVKKLKQKRIEVQLSGAANVTGARETRHNMRSRAAAAPGKNTGSHNERCATDMLHDDAVSHHYEFHETAETEDTPLFDVAPIAPCSPFKFKDVITSYKPEKPTAKSTAATKIAKCTVPFDIEEALPWRDIMEHELVIESA